jgi:hypothetical protein
MIAIRKEDGIPVWGVVIVGHKSIVSLWESSVLQCSLLMMR